MNPIEWLCANARGFVELPPEVRDAIMHFSLLWSYFEAKALNKEACARKILEVANQWEEEGRLNVAAFDGDLAYFQDRYFPQGGATTFRFDALRFYPRDMKPLVEAVLKGENTNNGDRVAALLIIVFRLRNNLFHGEKWTGDQLGGQFGNFTHANAILMCALEIALRGRGTV